MTERQRENHHSRGTWVFNFDGKTSIPGVHQCNIYSPSKKILTHPHMQSSVWHHVRRFADRLAMSCLELWRVQCRTCGYSGHQWIKGCWQQLGFASPMVSIPPVDCMTESGPMPQLCINVHVIHAIPTFSLRSEDDSSSNPSGGVQFWAVSIQC